MFAFHCRANEIQGKNSKNILLRIKTTSEARHPKLKLSTSSDTHFTFWVADVSQHLADVHQKYLGTYRLCVWFVYATRAKDDDSKMPLPFSP
jgi:hypothetical protein